MNDDFSRRAELVEALDRATPAVRVFRVLRFRGQTVSNLLAGFAQGVGGAVVDMIAGTGEDGDANDGEAEDRRPPGLAVVALDAAGQPAGRLAFHPIQPDLEAFVMEEVVRAARRLGAAVELFAEQTPLERWEPTELGAPVEGAFRDAQAPSLALFEGCNVSATRDGDGLHLVYEQKTPPAWWVGALALVFAVLFWWAVPIALLFSAGREALRSIFRATFRGHVYRWEARLTPEAIDVRTLHDGSEGTRVSVARRGLVLVSFAPRGWTSAQAKSTSGLRGHELRVLTTDGFVYVPLPHEIERELGPALRRALSSAAPR
jgi:phage baseplate assembly protein W